ncbi:hypothetical protein D3C85_1364070 [compost metagenome]
MVIDLILLCRALLASGKAIGEDLIEDLIVDPLRAVVRIIDGELLEPRRRKTAKALRGKPQLAVIPQQLKAVTSTCLPLRQIDSRPPGGDARLRLTAQFVHRQRRLFVIHFGAQHDALRLIFSCQPERNH